MKRSAPSSSADDGAKTQAPTAPTVAVIKFYSKRSDDPKYAVFSNFAKYPIYLDDKVWPTSEHYYQAMKFPSDPAYQERIRTSKKPGSAKKLGRTKKVPLRADWETEKERVMATVLHAKFTQFDALKQLLLSTGDATLVEDSPTDKYWGCGKKGDGKNRLGVLLMELRTRLRNESSPATAAEATTNKKPKTE